MALVPRRPKKPTGGRGQRKTGNAAVDRLGSDLYKEMKQLVEEVNARTVNEGRDGSPAGEGQFRMVKDRRDGLHYFEFKAEDGWIRSDPSSPSGFSNRPRDAKLPLALVWSQGLQVVIGTAEDLHTDTQYAFKVYAKSVHNELKVEWRTFLADGTQLTASESDPRTDDGEFFGDQYEIRLILLVDRPAPTGYGDKQITKYIEFRAIDLDSGRTSDWQKFEVPNNPRPEIVQATAEIIGDNMRLVWWADNDTPPNPDGGVDIVYLSYPSVSTILTDAGEQNIGSKDKLLSTIGLNAADTFWVIRFRPWRGSPKVFGVDYDVAVPPPGGTINPISLAVDPYELNQSAYATIRWKDVAGLIDTLKVRAYVNEIPDAEKDFWDEGVSEHPVTNGTAVFYQDITAQTSPYTLGPIALHEKHQLKMQVRATFIDPAFETMILNEVYDRDRTPEFVSFDLGRAVVDGQNDIDWRLAYACDTDTGSIKVIINTSGATPSEATWDAAVAAFPGTINADTDYAGYITGRSGNDIKVAQTTRNGAQRYAHLRPYETTTGTGRRGPAEQIITVALKDLKPKQKPTLDVNWEQSGTLAKCDITVTDPDQIVATIEKRFNESRVIGSGSFTSIALPSYTGNQLIILDESLIDPIPDPKGGVGMIKVTLNAPYNALYGDIYAWNSYDPDEEPRIAVDIEQIQDVPTRSYVARAVITALDEDAVSVRGAFQSTEVEPTWSGLTAFDFGSGGEPTRQYTFEGTLTIGQAKWFYCRAYSQTGAGGNEGAVWKGKVGPFGSLTRVETRFDWLNNNCIGKGSTSVPGAWTNGTDATLTMGDTNLRDAMDVDAPCYIFLEADPTTWYKVETAADYVKGSSVVMLTNRSGGTIPSSTGEEYWLLVGAVASAQRYVPPEWFGATDRKRFVGGGEGVYIDPTDGLVLEIATTGGEPDRISFKQGASEKAYIEVYGTTSPFIMNIAADDAQLNISTGGDDDILLFTGGAIPGDIRLEPGTAGDINLRAGAGGLLKLAANATPNYNHWPSGAGTSGQVLTSGGNNAAMTWQDAGGTGTVTQVDVATGLSASVDPITTSGEIQLDFDALPDDATPAISLYVPTVTAGGVHGRARLDVLLTGAIRNVGTYDTVNDYVLHYDAGSASIQKGDLGNSDGDIPVSNGTLCTNLNADMVDGIHAAGFVQSITGGVGIDVTGSMPNLTLLLDLSEATTTVMSDPAADFIIWTTAAAQDSNKIAVQDMFDSLDTAAISAGAADQIVFRDATDSNLKLSTTRVGNSSGYIPLSNGTLCTNLNADMVDGVGIGTASGDLSRVWFGAGAPGAGTGSSYDLYWDTSNLQLYCKDASSGWELV